MILVDSSAWIAFFSTRDPGRDPARETFASLISEREPLLVTDYIIDETFTFFRSRTNNPKMIQDFDGAIMESISKKLLNLLWTDEKIFWEARRQFLKYSDQRFSFTDCVSFAIAHKLGIKRIFSFDSDFRIMGFDVIPHR